MKLDTFFPKIEWKQKWAFFWCVIIMLITHLYMFTNKIINHDDANRLLVGDTDEVKIQHGRWAGVIFDKFSGSSVSIPYVMGVISILAFAGTAVVLVSLFRVEKKLSIVLFCGLLCTFPVSANIFLYSYIADVYYISMFIAAWGVWLLVQDNWLKKVFGMILLTLACGCYQAFWCLGMAFLFLYFLLEFLNLQKNWKDLAIQIARCFIFAIISLVLYLTINKIVQSISGFGATDYQGLSGMGQFDGLLGFAKVFVYAYYEFIQFFYLKGSFTGSTLLVLFNVVLTIVVMGIMIQQTRKEKHPAWHWIVLVLFIGLIPLASNLVSVVSMNQIHILMQYAFIIPYLLCIILLDRCFEEKSSIAALSYVLIGIIAYSGYLTDNEIYFRQQLNYEATYSYTIRLLSRIETMEGYEPSDLIALINEHPQKNDRIQIMLENYPEEMNYFSYLDDMVGTEPHTFVKRANDISDFCKYYHGYDLQLVEMERLEELAETDEFMAMPTYPQEGSMQYINGVLVIKLANAE